MDNLYANLCSTTMPDVVLAHLGDLNKLDANEIQSTGILRVVRNYARKTSSLVHQTPPGILCSLFNHWNFDHHFEETLNFTLQSIPIETVDIEVHPVEVLITVGWAVLAVYQHDSVHHSMLLSSIVQKLSSLNLEKEKTDDFFNKLWNQQCCKNLPLSLLNDMVVASPYIVENLVAELIGSLSTIPVVTCRSHIADVLFQRSDVDHWLQLCASSPKIFQISTAIINSFLLYSRGEQFVATFVAEFHGTVNKLCKGKIVNLYPLHLHKLVTCLNIKPTVFSSDSISRELAIKNVIEPLLDGLTSDRCAYLCLLSHFSKWIPHLLQYSIEIGEARIFSKELFTLDLQ